MRKKKMTKMEKLFEDWDDDRIQEVIRNRKMVWEESIEKFNENMEEDKMTNSEFISKIEKLGFKVEDHNEGNLLIVNNEGSVLARVSSEVEGFIDIGFPQFNKLFSKVKKDLILLLGEYASTPIKKRREVKKYKLRAKVYPIPGVYERSYLNYDILYDEIILGGRFPHNSRYEVIFTDEEISVLNERYNILRYYEMIEVE